MSIGNSFRWQRQTCAGMLSAGKGYSASETARGYAACNGSKVEPQFSGWRHLVTPSLQNVVRSLLVLMARHIGHNRGSERRQLYPQLWDCWPKWTGRKHPSIFSVRVRLCGWLTGHEISKTEWGYGGGKYADMNCRWCDKTIRVPVADTFKPESLPDLGDTDAI